MINYTSTPAQIPAFFKKLIFLGCLSETDMAQTEDGLFAARISIEDILARRGIISFPNFNDDARLCQHFYDDWFLYAVAADGGHIYSLFKMREQETDAERGYFADGDTPGVTVSFISFDTDSLEACLRCAEYEQRSALNAEIDRVVAAPGQNHHPELKRYFVNPAAKAPYLMAELYVQRMAGYAKNGVLPVPRRYEERKPARLRKFIDGNNKAAGHIVCDHEHIFIADPNNLSMAEKLAILASHTANTSFNAFAAEVQCHALFLVAPAKLRIPFLNFSLYASAIRADLSIADSVFESIAPFRRENSRLLRNQAEIHGKY